MRVVKTLISPFVWAWNFVCKIFEELFVLFQLMKFNKILRNKLIEASEYESLSDEILKSYLESEWSRAKDLNDKLQKLTAALSVSIVIGGYAGNSMLVDLPQSWLKTSISILFCIAAIFLLLGVLIGFDGLRPTVRWGYGAKFMRAIATSKEEAHSAFVEAAIGFERQNAMLANRAEAATISIRNGIIFFALAMMLSFFAVISGIAGKKPATNPPRPGCMIFHNFYVTSIVGQNAL